MWRISLACMMRDEDVREKTLHTIRLRLPGPPNARHVRHVKTREQQVKSTKDDIEAHTARQVAEHRRRNIDDGENIPGTRYRSTTYTIQEDDYTDCLVALLISESWVAEGRLDYPNRAHLVDQDHPRTSRFQRFRSAGLPQQRAVDGTTSTTINYST
jgi:hypothetical protein